MQNIRRTAKHVITIDTNCVAGLIQWMAQRTSLAGNYVVVDVRCVNTDPQTFRTRLHQLCEKNDSIYLFLSSLFVSIFSRMIRLAVYSVFNPVCLVGREESRDWKNAMKI